MKYHFIGICGAGMSAVAKLVRDSGHSVSGSDEGFYPPISLYLTENNIPCSSPYKKENIPDDADVIVIGKHAKLTKEDNEEVAAAFAHPHARILSFPEVLYELTQTRERIVVAGSYGKSTVTALLSFLLSSKKETPGYFIGALPLTPKENASLGTAAEFVIEGDEYPSLNWDNTSKFLYYKPEHLLVTALAHDHVNVFPTHEDYLRSFRELIAGLPSSGTLLMCGSDHTVAREIPHISHSVITYGLSKENKWSAENISYGDTTTFDLTCEGKKVAELSTILLGRHNIENCIGAAALLLETKKMTAQEIANTLPHFRGIVRRLDKKTEESSVLVYEGFGSSVDKALSAIEALTLHFPTKKLVILFEPHTFSWRNRAALHWYDTVFKGAASVLIYSPPHHGAAAHDQVSHDEIISRVSGTGMSTYKIHDKESLHSSLKETLTADSLLLILSSGDMDGLIAESIQETITLFPAHK